MTITLQEPKKWIDICKGFVENINAMDPKDRLGFVSCTSDLIYVISSSMQGWSQWYHMEFSKAFSSKPLSNMSEDALENLFSFFKDIAIKILDIDIKVTEDAERKFVEKANKGTKTAKKKKSSNGKKDRTPYVA